MPRFLRDHSHGSLIKLNARDDLLCHLAISPRPKFDSIVKWNPMVDWYTLLGVTLVTQAFLVLGLVMPS